MKKYKFNSTFYKTKIQEIIILSVVLILTVCLGINNLQKMLDDSTPGLSGPKIILGITALLAILIMVLIRAIVVSIIKTNVSITENILNIYTDKIKGNFDISTIKEIRFNYESDRRRKDSMIHNYVIRLTNLKRIIFSVEDMDELVLKELFKDIASINLSIPIDPMIKVLMEKEDPQGFKYNSETQAFEIHTTCYIDKIIPKKKYIKLKCFDEIGKIILRIYEGDFSYDFKRYDLYKVVLSAKNRSIIAMEPVIDSITLESLIEKHKGGRKKYVLS